MTMVGIIGCLPKQRLSEIVDSRIIRTPKIPNFGQNLLEYNMCLISSCAATSTENFHLIWWMEPSQWLTFLLK